jgi:hypothetical protein
VQAARTYAVAAAEGFRESTADEAAQDAS